MFDIFYNKYMVIFCYMYLKSWHIIIYMYMFLKKFIKNKT